MNDLAVLHMKQVETVRCRAESENSNARLQLALVEERCAYLISQYEPVAALGLDRERLRLVLDYIRHGDLRRLDRELRKLLGEMCEEGKS